VTDEGNGFAPHRRTEADEPSRPSLAVELGEDLRFPTPVLAASGCFNTGREMGQVIDLRALGGIVTKSVTLGPRKGLPVPRMAETASGMLNAIGLQNPGVEEFVSKEGPWISALGVPVVVSVAGRSVEEFSQVVLRVKDVPGVVAIEANISCPNVERRNQVFACHPDQAAGVIASISRLTRLPVFAKLTADTTNVVEVAEACVRAGAFGLSLINTVLGMAIDIETFEPKLGAVTGGLSGPAIKPIAIRCVHQVAEALPGVPIMGIGGVRSAEDVVEFLLAGASAVQVGTANFFDPDAIPRILGGLVAFMERKGFGRPADLTARMRVADHVPEPAHRRG